MNSNHTKRDEHDHRLLVFWAADCAKRMISHFEGNYPEDDRPRKALEAGRAWARDEITMSEARTAAYAIIAATSASDTDATTEHDWQYQRLAKHLQTVVFPD